MTGGTDEFADRRTSGRDGLAIGDQAVDSSSQLNEVIGQCAAATARSSRFFTQVWVFVW